ncbi:hypothetical protein SH1V18_40280 [Vallitalea longa]|uniref:Uncharacterized protein n=1 Tax=Vallitalea longa TaxID=2936439 RepID=A0A9W6DHK2_9FIRM|nr:hypothetical protein [Vallitalea longa]GKX31548.1 hypothetical protein SH1V18_40280 [Vallitalea longa]
MACNISTCCGVSSTAVKGCKCNVQYGFENKTITITTAGTFDIWQQLNIPSLSGTIVIQPKAPLTTPTVVRINDVDQGIILNAIYARSINPLNSVSLVTLAGTTELCISIIANGFECC